MKSNVLTLSEAHQRQNNEQTLHSNSSRIPDKFVLRRNPEINYSTVDLTFSFLSFHLRLTSHTHCSRNGAETTWLSKGTRCAKLLEWVENIRHPSRNAVAVICLVTF